MLGCGDMRETITLLARVSSDSRGDARDDYAPLMTVRAAKRDMSQREFAAAGAANYERVMVYTIRTPLNVRLSDGLVVEDADGERCKAVQIIHNRPKRGFTELRVVGKGLEGYGYA